MPVSSTTNCSVKFDSLLRECVEYGNKNYRKGEADSNLERMFKHLSLCQKVYFESNNEGGKQFLLNLRSA